MKVCFEDLYTHHSLQLISGFGYEVNFTVYCGGAPLFKNMYDTYNGQSHKDIERSQP